MSATTSSPPKKPKGILKKPSATSSAAKAKASPTATPTTVLPIPITPFPVEERASSSSITTTTTTAAATTATPSARELAIQQALLIQSQRIYEDQIQEATIQLSHLPLSRPSSPSSPSPTDLTTFRTLIRLFQPSDYEDLIAERNTLKNCGYVLCPNPRRKLAGTGEYKLLNFGRRDFNIVPRKELERWCSPECARRAMYIKVQLCEWAAGAGPASSSNLEIELLDEPRENQQHSKGGSDDTDETARQRLARELRSLEAEKEKKATRDAIDLALERGDKPTQTKPPVKVTIREKAATAAAQEPSLDKDNDNEDHLLLDGYKPKWGQEIKNSSKDIVEAVSKLSMTES